MTAAPPSRPKGSDPERVWDYAAPITICPDGKPAFHELPKIAGVYVLEFGGEAYVGHAEKLRRRLTEYRNCTDSIQEHYLRDRIHEAGGGGVYCMTSGDLESKSHRLALEQKLIKELRDGGGAPINKSGKPSTRFLAYRVAKLEEMLVKAREDHRKAGGES